ncbi:hypothetical protein EJB05_27555 [Eragrostis curvula]|uniref:Uncharacterized protein n=1 Tax=Eragrostis curvula TaxID=38414 RepID=A0A5J9UND4_9POAL|nr:hypothetical protein EJB05_27555 [Eragrostis curvula]
MNTTAERPKRSSRRLQYQGLDAMQRLLIMTSTPEEERSDKVRIVRNAKMLWSKSRETVGVGAKSSNQVFQLLINGSIAE